MHWLRKRRKSNLIGICLWRTNVSEAVCKRDWHDVRLYLFFNVWKCQIQYAETFIIILKYIIVRYSLIFLYVNYLFIVLPLLFITFIFISCNYHQLYNISYNFKRTVCPETIVDPKRKFILFYRIIRWEEFFSTDLFFWEIEKLVLPRNLEDRRKRCSVSPTQNPAAFNIFCISPWKHVLANVFVANL